MGFAPDSDQWRAVQYLSNIFELINEYDRHNPFTPSTQFPMDNWSRPVDRPGQSVPPPSDEAVARRHYRAHLNTGPPPGPAAQGHAASGGDVTQSPQEELVQPAQQEFTETAEDTRRRLQNSLSRLPVNARVRIQQSADGPWLSGTIVKSWLPRWRMAESQPTHRICVEYDGAQGTGHHEHDVQDVTIEVIGRGADEALETPDLAAMDLDNKRRKRLRRLQRELVHES